MKPCKTLRVVQSGRVTRNGFKGMAHGVTPTQSKAREKVPADFNDMALGNDPVPVPCVLIFSSRLQ